MKRLFLFLIAINIQLNSYSQFHELGAFIGGTNYIGDVGASYYVYPENVALGLIYKWNMTTRYSLRASALFTEIKKSDYNPADSNRFKRKYRFNNPIQELSVGIEINFVDFNLHGSDREFAHYLYLGISYFQHDLFYHDLVTREPVEYDTGRNFALPIIVGVKTNLNAKTVVGLEIGARATFTDNIDGSNPDGPFKNSTALKFGNLNNNDWYVFTGLTISFTFGELPCYCKE